jgi:proton-dependent oligopeptide transporter, POT family
MMPQGRPALAACGKPPPRQPCHGRATSAWRISYASGAFTPTIAATRTARTSPAPTRSFFMTSQTLPFSKTRSFSAVLVIEMWERFGFYGMQVLMVTFLMKQLGFVDTRANLVWGAAAALIYATPAIGGWVGDKLLGTRRTMLIGAVVLAIGYGILWIPPESLGLTANGSGLMGLLTPANLTYLALGVIVVGNGFFKPNAGNLVRKIYEGDDTKIDSAFTIYYMAVNIGSMLSMSWTPWIRDHLAPAHGASIGWHTAFGSCSVGLVLGLVIYFFMRRALQNIGSPADAQPIDMRRALPVFAVGFLMIFVVAFILQSELIAKICVYAAGVLILGVFAHLIRSSQPSERAGLIAALVLTIQTIFFFIFYSQMATSLNLFAQKNVDLSFNLFGMHLFNWIPEQYQNLNSIWIVVLSPLLVFAYNTLGRIGKDPSIAMKFALGFAAVAVGFFMYGLGARSAVNGQVSSWTMVWGYGWYSLGELLVSGLGLAMIARYVPARMGGFMMGAYYVAVGLSQYLGSIVANIAHIPDNITDPLQSMTIYVSLFNKLGFVGIGCVVIALAMLPLMNRLSASHSDPANNHDPLPAVRSEEFN